MNLQTKIPIKEKSKNPIDYHSNMLLLGSCFVENIGAKLNYFKFQNVQNPFGILFHPKAIETLVTNAVNQKKYSEEDIFFHNEQWHAYDAHSALSSSSKEALLNSLNEQIRLTHQYLKKSTHIVITLGTSWVYRHIESNTIVANCHKVPQNKFKKELLSIESISKSLKNILSSIRNLNHNTSILLTISPLRHLKDGFIENTRSKAHLISAIHDLIDSQSIIENTQLAYVPSYEIMMDELRDYRFYAEDMIHPSQLAIDYVWERFKNVWITNTVFKTMERIETVQKGLKHKPFNPESKAHKKFLSGLEEKQMQLKMEYEHIVFNPQSNAL